MPVLSVSIPVRKESILAIAALKYGVEAEVIDREIGSSVLYVDLTGRTNKTMSVACEIGADVLDEQDKMPRTL